MSEKPISDLTFEAAYVELTQIIEQLENGTLTLESSVKLYERGRLLAEHCERLLEGAEIRIVIIDQNVDDTNINPNTNADPNDIPF